MRTPARRCRRCAHPLEGDLTAALMRLSDDALTHAQRRDAMANYRNALRRHRNGECDRCANERIEAALAVLRSSDTLRVLIQVEHATGRAWLTEAELERVKFAVRQYDKIVPRRPTRVARYI